MDFQKSPEEYLFNNGNTVFSSLPISDRGKKLPQVRQRVKENSRLLPTHAVDLMTEWYDRHYSNPYPTYRDCEMLAQKGNISINQVKQWFVNVRRRTQNQFRKTRDTRCTKRKAEPEDNQVHNRIKLEEEIQQPVTSYSYSTLSLDSTLSENNYSSQASSPTSYRFNYSTYCSPTSQTSPNMSQHTDSPIYSSSPVLNQNYFPHYSSTTSNFSSDYTSAFNYYVHNSSTTSDHSSYFKSPNNYQYHNNYQNVYNFQYY